MILTVDYDATRRCSVLSSSASDVEWHQLCRTIRDVVPELSVEGLSAELPWRALLAYRSNIFQFVQYHNCELRLTPAAKKMLLDQQYQSYATAMRNLPMKTAEVLSRLKAIGFRRELTSNQLSNVSKIANLPAAATFSVPGAGKTTEALAYYFINASADDRLLVVAPKNAFGAWDEQLLDCMGLEGKAGFARLNGGRDAIVGILKTKPRLMIMTYSQMPFIGDIVDKLLIDSSCFMFLDESHRIKGGRGRAWADSVLSVSYLPVKKLLLTGTPMPQSAKDLVPQFEFLYPDHIVDSESVIGDIQPLFVRTTQKELNIPEVDRRIVQVDMSEAQAAVYATLRSEAKRELSAVSKASKVTLRSIGKCYIRLLQFVSNPALLSSSLKYAFDKQIGALLLGGDGPKIDYACLRARELASAGKKVIIWSSFVQNVELISARLGDIGADYIHGGVDAGSDEEEETREGKIKRFHTDPNKMVLVANPAACSEGISLHKVCQHAIYVDRSFNAAQYLQSEDRIHRLGLRPDQQPVVEILQCPGTIDEVVNNRLTQKVENMAQVLNDESLSIAAETFDPDIDLGDEISEADALAILNYFGLDARI